MLGAACMWPTSTTAACWTYDAPLTTDRSADRVFGQPDFGTVTVNSGRVSAVSLYGPNGLALDAQGNLYVADSGDNRVVEYDWALVRLDLPLLRR